METSSTRKINQPKYRSHALKTYKIFKKLIKYSCYMAFIYLAIKGFMAWQ